MNWNLRATYRRPIERATGSRPGLGERCPTLEVHREVAEAACQEEPVRIACACVVGIPHDRRHALSARPVYRSRAQPDANGPTVRMCALQRQQLPKVQPSSAFVTR